MRVPVTYTPGRQMTATMARGRCTEAISAKAQTKVIIEITTVGANDRNICTERMSEFALEMSWPLCMRSK